MMKTTPKRSLALTLPLLAAAALVGCDDTYKANKLIDEANSLFEASKSDADAGDKARVEAADAGQANDEAGRKDAAARCQKSYQAAQSKLDEARTKMEGTLGMKLNADFTAYLKAKVDSWKKGSELITTETQVCAALETADLGKLAEFGKTLKQSIQDFKDADAAAEKIRTDHPDLFKK